MAGSVGRSATDAPDSRVPRKRKRAVRARTISVKRMAKRDLELGRALYPEEETAGVVRPRHRADCREGVRPCPFVSCVHHLYLDVSAQSGAIKVNFPDVDVTEMEALAETCALDVADRQGVTLEEVADAMNITRERVRQIETRALAKVRAASETFELRDCLPLPPPSRRRLPVVG